MEKDNKLLYEQIVGYLKDKIESKELVEDDKLPTELDLAEHFGVSRITSKRALEELRIQGLIYRIRGSGSFVAPQKVTSNAVYNTNTTVKPTNITNIISIVLPFDASNGGMMETIKGASEVLSQYGYFLSIHSCQRDFEKERDILSNLFDQKVGGVILYPISDRENLEVISKFYIDQFPIVTIDKYFESIPISYVVSDNAKGAYNSTKYLIDLGHQKIGFISDETIESATSIRRRYFGYCQALKENEISIDERYINTGFAPCRQQVVEYDKQKYNTIVNKLITNGVTAFVCVNDYVASAVMHSVTGLGFEVPKDISIVGFDDIEIATHLQVPLTTVSQDFYEMGRKAATLLLEDFEQKHKYNEIVLPTKMVVRNSCSHCIKN
ncbi:GntR family transcriptional regulator [Vallitalea okinawensis]|uniref:GntR family transcriptional regulator n=1 Tax=Vallitalea okinawensis TaxID=2078660 RepID=UPI000CFCDF96|nr:GntR family transcriptional regulator [Vallitalea okinawensis]